MEKNNLEVIPEKAAKVSGAFGHGILAGLIGTVAITAAQMIEMKISKREMSNAPVQAAGKVIGFKPDCEEEKECANKEKLNNLVHFSYGTSWGEARALISSFGLKGWKASLLHFGAIWGAALVMLPSLKVAPPPTKWGVPAIAKDAFFHLVYAFAAGFAYDRVHKYSC